MARQPAPGDEPVLIETDEPEIGPPELEHDPEVPVADAVDQARDVSPSELFDPPDLGGEVSEYDALEQARVVALDEDEEGHDGPPDYPA
jgi:hypothetical protein